MKMKDIWPRNGEFVPCARRPATGLVKQLKVVPPQSQHLSDSSEEEWNLVEGLEDSTDDIKCQSFTWSVFLIGFWFNFDLLIIHKDL